jgi:antitoxin component YwqK of YwqJK toxin-antitoxin module
MKQQPNICSFNYRIATLFFLIFGFLNAQDTSYYSNGSIKEISVSENQHLVVVTEYDKRRNPLKRSYYYDGQLTIAERYEKRYRNGGVLFTIIIYFPNGKISEIGKCKWKESYHHIDEQCIRIGKWRTYYENGKLNEIGRYSACHERTGKWKSYHENGHLGEKGRYNELGECIGTWKSYDINGRLVARDNYNE